MSNSPSALSSTKRKSTSRVSTPATARKRRKANRDSPVNTSSKKYQQTLTQAQWVAPIPSGYDDADLHLLEDEPQSRKPAPPRQPRRLEKRDSTLTQMAFFSHTDEQDDLDDSMISSQSPSRDDAIPQLDGTPRSPRKPRKRKTIPTAMTASANRNNGPESQEDYKPTRRERKPAIPANEPVASNKRTSKRLAAKVLSDPVQNHDYFTEALGMASISRQDGFVGEAGIATAARPTSRSSAPPQTPKKPKATVLSSQSPESIRASTRWTASKVLQRHTPSQRTPLAERSTNVLVRTSPKSSRKRRRAHKNSPVRSKIVTFKLPKRRQVQPGPIPDSSHLWSVPSSSPQMNNNIVYEAAGPVSARLMYDLEIPASSEPDSGRKSSPSTEENLAGLDELPGREALNNPGANTESSTTSRDSTDGIIVRDFTITTPHSASQGGHPRAWQIPSPPPTFLQVEPSDQGMDIVDDELDFGSPVANDTQFNIQVAHRVSSPLPTEPSPVAMGAANNLEEPPTATRRTIYEPAEMELPAVERIQSSQSSKVVPALVTQSAAKLNSKHAELENIRGAEAFPQPVIACPATLFRTTSTQVPLNDTEQWSSSPRLRPLRSNTPNSALPASMPHPSQISTQEPTQAYLPPSSMTLDDKGSEDIITIKDSSSSMPRLSQVPRHAGSSQAVPDFAAGLDEQFEWEEDEDFDLDPSSLPPLSRDLRGPSLHSQKHEELEPSEAHFETTRIDDDPCDEQNTTEMNNEPTTPERPSPLTGSYSPIPGFDNDTQSNFTQNGHVTAAYIHRQRDAGIYPSWFVPTPYQVPGYTRWK
jgi:hypothetical protein